MPWLCVFWQVIHLLSICGWLACIQTCWHGVAHWHPMQCTYVSDFFSVLFVAFLITLFFVCLNQFFHHWLFGWCGNLLLACLDWSSAVVKQTCVLCMSTNTSSLRKLCCKNIFVVDSFYENYSTQIFFTKVCLHENFGLMVITETLTVKQCYTSRVMYHNCKVHL